MFRRRPTGPSNKSQASNTGLNRRRPVKRDWSRRFGFETLEDRYLLSAAPLPLGPQYQVNPNGEEEVGLSGLSIASDAAGDRVVVWSALNQGVLAQRYNAAGVAEGSQIQVMAETENVQPVPSVAMDASGDFVVAWQEALVFGQATNVYAQLYNSAGVVQGSEFIVNSGTAIASGPAAAMDASGDFVITFQDGPDIDARRYNAAGVAQGSQFVVNSDTARIQGFSLAMDSAGDFVVAWESYDQPSGQPAIVAQRFNAGGTAQGSEFLVTAALAGGQYNPAAAMDSTGDFVIAWEHAGGGSSGWGAYAQRYNASGAAQGSAFLVNAYTFGNEDIPSVAMDSAGDFVVAWEVQNNDASGVNIYAQAYDSAGAANGSEFLISSNTTGFQGLPVMAMDATGDFTVAWPSTAPNLIDARNFAGNFSPSPVGSEFQVNTYTTGSKNQPKVATDAAGDYVVVWQSQDQDGSGYGIYAQRV